jgi:hypothetical protein
MLACAQICRIAEGAAGRAQPHDLLSAIEMVGRETVGQSLFTVTRFDARIFEVERLYSSDPAAYPLGGRKKKRDTAWGRQVLIERRPFLGEGAEAIRAAFDDHELILGLGLRSAINMPVVFAAECLGVVNFLCPGTRITDAAAADAHLLSVIATPAFL